jgi:protein-disulfide isomerase
MESQEMKWMTRLMLIAAASGMLLTTPVLAQDEGGNDAALKQILSELRALRGEVKALQNDVRKLQNEVKSAQRTANPPPRQRPTDTTVYDIKVGDSAFLGPADAKVTITEFVCLQCPFCIREWPKLQQVMKDYPNDVKVVFKHFPLSFHKKAKPVHAACALAQKEKGVEGFWQMHDMIIAAPKKLEVADMRGYAEKMGLNMAEFDRVMASTEEIDKLLAPDLVEARKCKVRGTPSVFINGLKLSPRNMPDYKKRIDAILAGGKQPTVRAAAKGEKAKGIINLAPGKQPTVQPLNQNTKGNQ